MPSEQTDQANIEQWVFKPRSLLVLCWVAVPFFLTTWLVWFAFAWAGRLGWLFWLIVGFCVRVSGLPDGRCGKIRAAIRAEIGNSYVWTKTVCLIAYTAVGRVR